MITPSSLNERLNKEYSRGLRNGIALGVIFSLIGDLLFRYVF